MVHFGWHSRNLERETELKTFIQEGLEETELERPVKMSSRRRSEGWSWEMWLRELRWL